MATISRRDLRNNIGEVLRRAEAGERLVITVSGRPVAELGPIRDRQWVSVRSVADIWDHPVDDGFARDLAEFGAELRDPWAS